MAGPPLPVDSLNFSILFFSKVLIENKCEHFLFFGSLLGITRNLSAIDGDDDVDFYVNQNDYFLIVEILQKLDFKICFEDTPNHTKYFIQANGKIQDHIIRVDFYFYDAGSDNEFLLERWNFLGDPEKEELLLKTPKIIIFPLKKFLFKSVFVNLPKSPELVCKFLYGADWKVPIKKTIDYYMSVSNGKPIQIPIKK